MILFSIILSAILVIAAMVQWLIAIAFEKSFTHRADRAVKSTPSNLELDKVGVVLGIRGWDPSLQGCLIGLLNQAYPKFEIQIVIDNRQDAAWHRIHQIKKDFDHQELMQISELGTHFSSCSLKCSAMIQGVQRLSHDVHFVATIDADVNPHPNWLTELISPMVIDPKIGLVTGNQWFEPPENGNWGAILRSTWSAGALVLSIYFANPWAGSMAMRRKQIDQLGLIECWKQAAVDDGPLVAVYCHSDRRRHFAVPLVMVNRENCTMRYAISWMRRMLTWSRLYEPTYSLSLLHAFFSNAVMIAVFYSLFYFLWQGDQWNIAIPLFSLIVSGILSVAAYLSARRVVEKSCQVSGRIISRLPIRRYWRLFWCVPLAQAMFLFSSVSALMAKKIRWRGIWYHINSDKSIQLVEYQPYFDTFDSVGPNSQNSIG